MTRRRRTTPQKSKFWTAVLSPFRAVRELHRSYFRTLFKFILLLRQETAKDDLKEVDTGHLENVRFFKDILLGRLFRFYMLVIIVPLILLGFFTLYPRVDKTLVTADLYVSSVTFNYQCDDAEEAINGTSYNRSRGEVNILDSRAQELNTVVTDFTVLPAGHSRLGFPALKIPNASRVTFAQPFPGMLWLIASNKDTSKVAELTLAADTATLAFPENKQPLQLNRRQGNNQLVFSKKFNDNKYFKVYFDMLENFQCTGVRASKLQFFEYAPTRDLLDTNRSSVLSGIIRFNETKNDSLIVHEGDQLQINPADTAIVKISLDAKGVRIQFQTEISSLKAGASLLQNSDKLNQMPRAFQIFYNRAPYFWLLLATILPALLTLLIRPRRQL